MNEPEFWQLIDPAAGEHVVSRAAELLAARPRAEIVAAERTVSGLLVQSYRSSLWAAAYLVNGGCSDDGFDYFRGWLLTQGREVFTRAVADPDSLADVPAIRAAAAEGAELECEEILYLAATAHLAATGEPLPEPEPVALPPLDADFDFEDPDEVRERLPRLSALFG
ncbi:DUF4240 domain-containing protein [Amycolatopsis rhabdoformis]|uniref:DUF4240 domain-containing protein n=1 Tax=Amycolatopsis rhabdoformis TaxID=1448059 RepID=A0ABZ1HXT9_9PSEU|nr:DUF4240 domain-containing protein [Amycolatopsis rhabdoformis]WSE26956.1 DUF4240 domain-containing protein [Amycolatopsis rhabdoformis]